MSEQQRARRRRQRQRRRQRRRDEVDAPEIDEIEAEGVETDDTDGDGSRLGDPVSPPSRPATIFGLPRFIFLMSAGISVAVLVVIVIGQVVDVSDDIAGVTRFPDQGRQHLAEGELFTAYNSTPATSGPQEVLGVPAGNYGPDEEPPFDFQPTDAQLLPVLEAGGLAIHYDPDALDENQVEQLRDFADLARTATPNLVLTANPNLETPIAATAWTHLLSLDELGENFIDELARFVLDQEDSFYRRFVLERAPATIDLGGATLNSE